MNRKSVALVTGSSRGLGRAIALRLARDGYVVAVNYVSRREEALAAVREIEQAGGSAAAFQGDVSRLDEVEAMRASIEDGLKLPVEVLVNNSGVLRRGDLGEFDPEAMDLMQRVNVDGVIHATTVFSGAMRNRGYGRIVNIASIAAFGTAMAGTTFYAATKAAVIALTRRFALALGPAGVTVNAVAPGFILTDMVSEGRTPAEVEASLKTMASKAMTGRTGLPEDVAHAVSFLVSPDSGFITAQVLKVDGGRTDYLA
jgi:3-oxoacyl-[acyl-carrier protein] reductase